MQLKHQIRYLISVFSVFFYPLFIFGQVVWTEPTFPTQNDDITVFFDASEGNAALKGFSGEIYAHTGVITNQSTGPTDWKHVVGNWGMADARTLMTRVSEDLYSLSYNIDDYYNLPPGEEVLRLAFVFRNVDGSIVGRDADGSDIFYDLYPESDLLFITVFSPAQPGSIYQEHDSIFIDLRLSDTASLKIYDNDLLIFDDLVDQASFYHQPAGPGFHKLYFEASSDTTISIETDFYIISDNQVNEDAPEGIQNGLNYYTDTSFVFQLYAPQKSFVYLLCPANSYTVNDSFRLKQSLDKKSWWLELPRRLFEEGNNTYQYQVDANLRIADPFSTVILDPDHDPFIQGEVMNTLPSYPSGMTSGIVTAFDLEKSAYDFEIDDFDKPSREKLVIYELLIRDFLTDHSFTSLQDTLQYLEKLGVNAIEIMPVNEFEGNISWGYNPSFHMAVDKYYGSRDELKSLIDAAHSKGIAVILDVVYNHAFSQSPLVQLYWDPVNSRPSPESPYLNPVARHPFNVGYDFNHESAATKAWVKQTLTYWITEFKVDGFRFDLSKGFTQFNSGDNAGLMAQYDPGRIAILKEYADHIWNLDSTSYVILEHFAENDEEIELSSYGAMLWGNMNHQFIEAAKGNRSELRDLDYSARNWSHPHLVGYMESHDEERMIYRTLREGESESGYNTRILSTALKRAEAASTIFYLVPGPKMLWQFGELGYDYSINYCQDGTVRNECRLDLKPVRWDYLQDPDRKHLMEVISALSNLKRNYPTFSSDNFEFNDGNLFVKTISFSHPDMDALVLANFRVINSEFIPKFPYTGIWYEYFSGDSLLVEDTDERMTFLPGEYKVYTSKRIELPHDFTTGAKSFEIEKINLYPNLISDDQSFYFELEDPVLVKEVKIFDINGISIDVSHIQNHKRIMLRIAAPLPSGIYSLQVLTDKKLFTGKLIRQ